MGDTDINSDSSDNHSPKGMVLVPKVLDGANYAMWRRSMLRTFRNLDGSSRLFLSSWSQTLWQRCLASKSKRKTCCTPNQTHQGIVRTLMNRPLNLPPKNLLK
ncbi:hypothetical protein ACOSQ3_019594 [Xanthoceras sorbifolium]